MFCYLSPREIYILLIATQDPLKKRKAKSFGFFQAKIYIMFCYLSQFSSCYFATQDPLKKRKAKSFGFFHTEEAQMVRAIAWHCLFNKSSTSRSHLLQLFYRRGNPEDCSFWAPHLPLLLVSHPRTPFCFTKNSPFFSISESKQEHSGIFKSAPSRI